MNCLPLCFIAAFRTASNPRRIALALCPGCGRLIVVPLDRDPSLHILRRNFSSIVRAFHQYYGLIRLPAALRGTLRVSPYSPSSLVRQQGHDWLSSVSPLTCPYVPPPLHRRGFGVLCPCCTLPPKFQPSPPECRLGPLYPGSPSSYHRVLFTMPHRSFTFVAARRFALHP